MDDDMEKLPGMLSLLEQLKPYITDAQAYGRFYANLYDLSEACEWFLSVMKQNEGKLLTPDELENLLIDIDVRFIQHVTFHLDSLRTDLERTLGNFPNPTDEN
jgi:hypothetical protein